MLSNLGFKEGGFTEMGEIHEFFVLALSLVWFARASPERRVYLVWIQEGFTAEPPRNDSGADFQGNDSGFGPKVGVTAPKVGVTELQAKSRSYSGADPQNPNRIAQKGNPNRVWALLLKTLKAFLNPAKVYPPP